MRKATIAAALLIIGLGVAATLVLQEYKLDLIHVVVENAVVQKAPDSYPEATIRHTFAVHLEKAEATKSEEVYLQRLLKASQRLEKIQRLKEGELEELLEELDPATAAGEPSR